MRIVKLCPHGAWFDKSCLKFDKSGTVGIQKSVVTRAGFTRLDQVRLFPQFVGEITEYQRRVARQMTSMLELCSLDTWFVFSFSTRVLSFPPLFFDVPFFTLFFWRQFFRTYFFFFFPTVFPIYRLFLVNFPTTYNFCTDVPFFRR